MAGALRSARSEDASTSEQWDVFAYLSLCLSRMEQTINETTEAWEKRGYWVKADRFRLEWDWVGRYRRHMEQALQNEDFAEAVEVAAGLVPELKEVQPYKKSAKERPWQGSFHTWAQNS
jgi:hypothetical protein